MCSRRLILLVLFLAGPARACSTPVYRYALERWFPQPYELVVFQRANSTPEEKRAIDATHKTLDDSPANVTVTDINVANPMDPRYTRLWNTCKDKPLPWMVVTPPANVTTDGALQSAAFTPENVTKLLDSPLRKKLAQCILNGDAAEWVLVEGPDGAENDAKAKVLQDTIKKISVDFTQTARDRAAADGVPDDGGAPTPEDPNPIPPASINISFSLIRVARTDAGEDAFVRMLLTQDNPDSHATNGKADAVRAYLVFGRGRVLGPLTGSDIDEANVTSTSAFLVGPCMCEIKDQNPGMDLLMAADWDEIIHRQKIRPTVPATFKPDSVPENVPSTPLAVIQPSPPVVPATTAPSHAETVSDAPVAPGDTHFSLGSLATRPLLIAFILIAAGVALIWGSSRRSSK